MIIQKLHKGFKQINISPMNISIETNNLKCYDRIPFASSSHAMITPRPHGIEIISFTDKMDQLILFFK